MPEAADNFRCQRFYYLVAAVLFSARDPQLGKRGTLHFDAICAILLFYANIVG